jgi:hypothetical protein
MRGLINDQSNRGFGHWIGFPAIRLILEKIHFLDRGGIRVKRVEEPAVLREKAPVAIAPNRMASPQRTCPLVRKEFSMSVSSFTLAGSLA